MRRAAVLLLAVIGCSDGSGPPPPPPPPPAALPALELITDQLTDPVAAAWAPGDAARLFVVEQAGTIRVVENDVLLATPFLDIRGTIRAGGEEGLLGLAFHLDYAGNGRFYIYFTDASGNLRIVRYRASADPRVADPASGDTVLTIAHPGQSNHNGGQLAFGPDGMLYAGIGDGGGGGDPNGNGQNTAVLLGKLLRLDVDGTTGFTIPADNPFASGSGGAPEVWSYGLRNPWRFSFDRQSGDLYLGDVGQVQWEEVNVATAASGRGRGVNFGWNVMEGMHCYAATTCDQTGLTLPIVEYSLAGVPCAIIGGYVYRGIAVAGLTGHYLFGDHCAGFIRSFRFDGGEAVDQADWSPRLSPGTGLSSFAEDATGELYVMTLAGSLFRIVAEQ